MLLRNKINFHRNKRQIILSETRKKMLGYKKYTFFTDYPFKQNAQMTPIVRAISVCLFVRK